MLKTSITTVALGLAALASAEQFDIEVGNTYYDPQFVFVQPGDTIRWFWAGGTHDAVSGDSCGSQDGLFDSGTISSQFQEYEWPIPPAERPLVSVYGSPMTGPSFMVGPSRGGFEPSRTNSDRSSITY